MFFVTAVIALLAVLASLASSSGSTHNTASECFLAVPSFPLLQSNLRSYAEECQVDLDRPLFSLINDDLPAEYERLLHAEVASGLVCFDVVKFDQADAGARNALWSITIRACRPDPENSIAGGIRVDILNFATKVSKTYFSQYDI